MRIGTYILSKYAKQTYKKECFNVRTNAGIAVVIDILRKAGYEVEWCSSANVHKYDVVLFSMTSDCDWWEFIAERIKWAKGQLQSSGRRSRCTECASVPAVCRLFCIRKS